MAVLYVLKTSPFIGFNQKVKSHLKIKQGFHLIFERNITLYKSPSQHTPDNGTFFCRVSEATPKSLNNIPAIVLAKIYTIYQKWYQSQAIVILSSPIIQYNSLFKHISFLAHPVLDQTTAIPFFIKSFLL